MEALSCIEVLFGGRKVLRFCREIGGERSHPMAWWCWRDTQKGLASCVKSDSLWATLLLTAWYLVLAWAPAKNLAKGPEFLFDSKLVVL